MYGRNNEHMAQKIKKWMAEKLNCWLKIWLIFGVLIGGVETVCAVCSSHF